MEALGSSNRPSGISSIINRDKINHIIIDHPYTSSSNMAAATLASPTSLGSSYGPPPPPYASGWPPQTQTQSISGLISPPESRRTSDNKAEPPPPIQTAPPPQHRQSLPSIREALDNTPKPLPNPYASPISAASLPPTHTQLPYSQGSNVPRSYASEPGPFSAPAHPRHPSPPQPVHANPFSRPEQVPAVFAEARHSSLPSLQTAPPGPPPIFHSSRSYEPSRYEQDPRAPERLSNGYTHHPPQQGTYTYGHGPQMLPSGNPPSFTDPRYTPREREPKDNWRIREEEKLGSPFHHGLKRNLDVWDFENNLAQINVSSSTIQDWSRNYNQIAQEQQRPIPDRMPSLESCEEMLHHNQKILYSLQRMKETIHQQQYAIADQRHRDDYGPKGPSDYDEEMSMYGDDMKNQGYGGSESKKRRGRAAPPGRCHSCNRAETPEWRRGPDGARTLCNACGLHYAKLTRKNTMKQSQGSSGSSLRPKSMDEHSPRG